MDMENHDRQKYLAHVRQDAANQWHEHLLGEHLREVARLAGEFAAAFGSSDWARLAGLWHDCQQAKPPIEKIPAKSECHEESWRNFAL